MFFFFFFFLGRGFHNGQWAHNKVMPHQPPYWPGNTRRWGCIYARTWPKPWIVWDSGRTYRKLLCNLRRLKIQSSSLTKMRGTLFEIFWREIYLNSLIEPCFKFWGCTEVRWASWWTSCAGWVKAEDHVMSFCSQTDWYEKDNEISSSHCKFF